MNLESTRSVTNPETLYREAIVVDAHNHALDQAFWRNKKPGTTDPSEFQQDLTRLHTEGITAAILACYVPSAEAVGTHLGKKYPLLVFLQMVKFLHQELNGEVGNALILATSAADIEEAKKTGKAAVILGLEDAGPTEGGDLFVLRMLYKLGLRHVLLAHEGRNNIATSSCMYAGEDLRAYDPALDGPGGLTPPGKRFVREMNRLGMIIDVSHLSDASFWDVLEVSDKPVIASHSNTRAFPDLANTWKRLRNPTDEPIIALAEKGGVIGATGALIGGEHPTLNDVLDRIDYLVKLVGPDHVGFGTDYNNGKIVSMPAPYAPKVLGTILDLTRGLLKRGYSTEEVKNILGENFLRVFKEIMS